jgi:hypothetical protein
MLDRPAHPGALTPVSGEDRRAARCTKAQVSLATAYNTLSSFTGAGLLAESSKVDAVNRLRGK